MKNLSIIAIAVFCAACFSACEKTEKIDDFPAHKSQLVTNCFFSPDTCFIFNLSKSLSPLDNAPFRVMNSSSAYIRVYEDNVLFDSFRYNATAGNFAGTYNRIPTVGRKYRFECVYPGFPVTSAEDYLPDTVSVKKMSLYTTITQTYGVNDSAIYGNYNVNVNIDLDPAKTSKYAIVTLYYNNLIGWVNGGGSYYNYNNVVDMKDLNAQNESVFASGSLYITNEGGINSMALQWQSLYGYLYKNRTTAQLTIEIKTCTASSFEYLKRSALQYENADDPFSEPTPVTNNIRNGFGVFGGWNRSQLGLSY